MILWSTVLIASILLVLYFVCRMLEIWHYFKIVKKLPSPRGHPILGNLPDLMIPTTRLIELGVKWADSHPKMFAIWLGPMPVLLVIDPDLVELILGSQKHIDKSDHYQFLEPWLGKGLLTSTGQKWRSHRKMLTPAFHFTILENFIEVFAEKSQILIKKLEQEIECEDIDVFPFISRLTLDIICETAMGVSINAQDTEQKSEYIEAVCSFTDEIMHRIISLWLYPDFVYKLTASGRRMQKHLNILHGFSKKIIQERKVHFKSQTFNKISMDEFTTEGCKKKKQAFLDLLLEASENGAKLTDEEIREEVDTFMFEGHDTTASALGWTLRLLGERLDIQEKVYEELQDIFQGSERPPTSNDLKNMKYLERVIKEGLRRYPSVPILARILAEDIEFDGYTIPAGLRVVLLPSFTHHLPEHFQDNLGFNPDHFLPENIAKRHPYAYTPFSAGPRNCIGQKFAMLEEKTVLSTIIRNFKFVAVGEEPEPIPELIIRPETGIHLKFTKRISTI